MIRGAIFDADGTLLDSMPIWADAGARYLTGLGICPEPGLGQKLFSCSLEEGAAYLKAHYGLLQSPEEIRQGVLSVISGFYRREVQPKPGVELFLRGLREKNIPMAIATTGDEALLTAALERLHLREYFLKLVTCSALGVTKRQPDVYLAAAAALGTRPAETLVFEDTFFAIQTAKEAGFHTVAVEDAASCADRARIRMIADCYLPEYPAPEHFWKSLPG